MAQQYSNPNGPWGAALSRTVIRPFPSQCGIRLNPFPQRFNEELALEERMKGVSQVIHDAGYPDFIMLQVGCEEGVVGGRTDSLPVCHNCGSGSRSLCGRCRFAGACRIFWVAHRCEHPAQQSLCSNQLEPC